MNTVQFVNSANLKATGKLPTFASGSTKWMTVLSIANDKIDQWANELDGDWNSLYDPAYLFGSITATDSYDIDATIRKISDSDGDPVQVLNLNGTTSNFEIVNADQLKRYNYGNFCAQVGTTLKFNRVFGTADQEFGGKLYVPVYYYAPHLVKDTDVVPVNDPQWLVIETAAEINRNDIVKVGQYPALINEANALMTGMKDVNDAQVEDINRPWRPNGLNW